MSDMARENEMRPPEPGPRAAWPALAGAIGFNLIPIIGVLFWHWSAFALILLYWLENVAIGGRALLSMLACGLSRGPASLAASALAGAFFTLHFGLFCFVHGMFVATLFRDGEGPARMAEGVFDLAGLVGQAFASQSNLLIGFASILGWQAVQLVIFLARGEAARASLRALMAAPYPRMVVLHVTIIFGGMLLMASGWPVMGVAALAAFKTAYDAAEALGWKPGRRAPQPA